MADVGWHRGGSRNDYEELETALTPVPRLL